jgi:hypothetical protein
MPDIHASTIRDLVELILDLQARLEVAEEELGSAELEPEMLDQKREARLQALRSLPKPAWLLLHLQQVADHDVAQFLATIKSRGK